MYKTTIQVEPDFEVNPALPKLNLLMITEDEPAWSEAEEFLKRHNITGDFIDAEAEEIFPAIELRAKMLSIRRVFAFRLLQLGEENVHVSTAMRILLPKSLVLSFITHTYGFFTPRTRPESEPIGEILGVPVFINDDVEKVTLALSVNDHREEVTVDFTKRHVIPPTLQEAFDTNQDLVCLDPEAYDFVTTFCLLDGDQLAPFDLTVLKSMDIV